MASVEEQAIAAINAAEALALSNIEVLRQMKAILPKELRPLTEPAIRSNQLGVQLVAGTERAVVRKVSRATRASRKNLSKALKMANARLRNKNGSLKKGKSQADVMKLAQRLKKKM
tara:strand:+ start:104 stop:451 length:348 start_codon:yes stop_codon:yes gene_type:complete